MRVLLISANRTDVNMRTVPLGLSCVASALMASGHEVQLLDLMQVQDISRPIAESIDKFRPEVIGISLRNIDDQNMRSPRHFLDEANQVITEVKRYSSAPVVLGGAGYSIFPDAALSHSEADMGIQGEGEEAFRLLLKRLGANHPLAGVPGLYVKNKGLQGPRIFVHELDQLPLPDADFLLPRGKDAPMLPVQTRRGCPMGCSYCSTGAIEGTRMRMRSTKRVVEWITRLTEKGARQFYFVDNTFNLPASHAERLCRDLIRASLDVTWRCILYPLNIGESLVTGMAEAGCVEASIGLESGCERMLKSMRKRFTLNDVVKTNHLLRTHGIRRMGFLLLGGPGETRQSVEESLAFADALELDFLKITIGIRIYPHTLLAEQARTEGVIAAGDDLLFPSFYMATGLQEWIRERVAGYRQDRPHRVIET
jgi:radical SAM superfamily enzyme YgiQ (UPF0313 family)